MCKFYDTQTESREDLEKYYLNFPLGVVYLFSEKNVMTLIFFFLIIWVNVVNVQSSIENKTVIMSLTFVVSDCTQFPYDELMVVRCFDKID